MKKGILVLVTLVMVVMMGNVALANEARTFTDTQGNEILIEEVPDTVVSLSASNTEILYALGILDKVVGVDAYSNHPIEALEQAQIVGDYNGPNVEAVLALAPDLVFAGNYLQQDAIDALKNAGIDVVAVEATTYDAIIPSIELVADIMGVDSTAVINKMQDEEAQAMALSTECAEKSVYFAVSFGEWGDWSAGDGSFVSDMINALGAKNIADGLGHAWPMYSIEQLLENDPDVILISGDQSMADSFCEDAAYSALTAVENGNVFAINPDTSARPAYRITQAFIDIAQAVAQAK